MNLIHSKDIMLILRDVLKLIDPGVMNHGYRTAYILYKMLEGTNKFEKYELAEFAMIGAFHDVGVYKTNLKQEALVYDTKECMPHSIYGYLFFLNLTPFEDRAKILLYHHTDYNQVPNNGYEFLDVIHCLNVAEKMDIYSNILGSKFDYKMFEKYAGTKYSARALGLFYSAEKKYNVLEKLSTGEYKQELSELFDYLIFTNEEKRDLLLGCMYFLSFRSEYTMLDVVTCVHICEQLASKMMVPKQDREKLFYAAILHDAGMCVIPKDILEFPGRLTPEQANELKLHMEVIETILKGHVDPDVLDIVLAHHERGDGSGYPKKIRDAQMTKLQKILQVADVATALTNKRSYRPDKTREEVIEILREESDNGKLNKEVVRTLITYYDNIMEGVRFKSQEMIAAYNKMQESFENTYKNTKRTEES